MAELARDPSSIVSFVVVGPGAAAASVTHGFGRPFRGQERHKQLGVTGGSKSGSPCFPGVLITSSSSSIICML